MMRILMACLTAALATMPLLAQGPRDGRHGPGTEAIQEALNLTADQVAALQQNNQEMREAMRAIFEQGKEKHEALKAELDNPSPNPTIVGQLVLDAKASREQGEALRTEFREKALAVLDATQTGALETLKESEKRSPALREAAALNLIDGGRAGFGRGMQHGPGRGGPGGPGGFMGGRRG